MKEPKPEGNDLYIVGDPPVSNNLTFHDNEKEIGRLSWDDGIFKFEGKAEESAKVFFDFLIKLWNKED